MSTTRLSLEYDRKQAKRLRNALNDAAPEAIARLRAAHPRYGEGQPLPRTFQLADAQLVIAREQGEASWSRWKQFVELSGLALDERCTALVRGLCSANPEPAKRLLAREPDLATANPWTALVTGHAGVVEDWLAGDPSRATARGGPLNRAPLLYVTHSRLLGSAADAPRLNAVITLLLAAGANANAYYLQAGETDLNHRQTALYGAAGKANNPEATRQLLDAGADPTDNVDTDGGGETLYHTAEFADPTCLEMILAAGPKKRALDYCLGRAIDFLAPGPVHAFLDAGADPNIAIPWFGNKTHFQKAIQHGQSLAVIEHMLGNGADVDKTDDDGRDAVAYALRFGRARILDLLLERGASLDERPAVDRLIFAATTGDTATAQALIAEYPDIPLTESDYELLIPIARQGRIDAVAALLDLGLPVNHVGSHEMAALHEACFAGNLGAVTKLVEAGADINLVNGFGGTPVSTTMYGSVNCHDAMGGPTARPMTDIEDREYPEIVDYLLTRGAVKPAEIGGSDAVCAVLLKHGVGDN